MLEIIFSLIKGIGIGTILSALIIITLDYVEFLSIIRNKISTNSWYNLNDWFNHPYLTWKLKNKSYKEYWTENYVKTEKWLCREIQYKETTFWTVVKRIQIVKERR